MRIDTLPNIERLALSLLLSDGEVSSRDLRDQLAHVSSIDRTETGAGVYVIFGFDDDVRPAQSRATVQLSGVFAVSEGCGEIGFLLYVKNGLIDCLEAYSCEDLYPVYSECNFRVEGRPKAD